MILNQWYAILPSKKIKVGKVIGVKRMNMDLVIFRNKDGEIGCVVDQCTHRGAALSLGKIKDNCIQCPFHGLEFNKIGKCVFIPANGKSSREEISRYNIKHYIVKEENEIIYIWYGDEEKVTNELPFFDKEINNSFVFSEFEDYWNSHYSRCIENQLDVVHLPFVHKNTIGRGNKTLVNGPKLIWEDGILTTSANNEVDNGQKPKLPENCVIKETYLKFLFPNIWMNHINDKIKIIIYFAPVDNENTILYIRFYCKVSRIKIINRSIAYIGKFANKIIERQDKRVVITQKPKISSVKSKEKLLLGDAPIIKYRKIRENLINQTEN